MKQSFTLWTGTYHTHTSIQSEGFHTYSIILYHTCMCTECWNHNQI